MSRKDEQLTPLLAARLGDEHLLSRDHGSARVRGFLDLNRAEPARGWEPSAGMGPSSFDSAAHFAGACGVTVSGASSCEATLGCQVSRCPLRTVLGPRRWCPR
jgi:hypothetical protein